jgi:V/A-type H+/Na+-transporting ATPase subunit A
MDEVKQNNIDEVNAEGTVIKAFGNLLHVQFTGDIKQGEIGFVDMGSAKLSSEVIEIKNDVAKMQVFEDTREIILGTKVEFTKHLLEAELGPGLLTSIFDGLQNPLEKIADISGMFLTRGVYVAPLDKTQHWDFIPLAKKNDVMERGGFLGSVKEGLYDHKIMVPFSLKKSVTITWVANKGSYTIEEVVAKGVDEAGEEYDFTMVQKWPVKMPLKQGIKRKPTEMMSTGLRCIDTQFPIQKGGSFCSPGPFGAGKTVLQHHLAKYSSVDIVVVAACGERAGEVVEVLREFPHLIDEKTKKPMIERTVIICNTSSMPVAAREASVYMGVTIAEYYRQMGYDVLVLADSTSRWAQAMREISGRLEEIPGEEAFPAYLSSRIAAFYERSGVLKLKDGSSGSLTIGGTVSPAGGNFEEPVTQATLAVVGAFLGLSRYRSDARKYPAIDPLISWTKYLDNVGKILEEKIPRWPEKVKTAFDIIQMSDEISKRMEVVGEEGTVIEDIIIYLKGELYDICYLQQNAFDKEDAYCPLDRQIELFDMIHKVFEASFHFDNHDAAHTFFLALQNDIKNMNFMPYQSQQYKDAYSAIEKQLLPQEVVR